jgi:hypothetical protein
LKKKKYIFYILFIKIIIILLVAGVYVDGIVGGKQKFCTNCSSIGSWEYAN